MTVVACHDGSPIVVYICPDCGATSHIHETQLDGAPETADVGARCSNCREIWLLPRPDVDAALARSRERIAE